MTTVWGPEMFDFHHHDARFKLQTNDQQTEKYDQHTKKNAHSAAHCVTPFFHLTQICRCSPNSIFMGEPHENEHTTKNQTNEKNISVLSDLNHLDACLDGVSKQSSRAHGQGKY